MSTTVLNPDTTSISSLVTHEFPSETRSLASIRAGSSSTGVREPGQVVVAFEHTPQRPSSRRRLWSPPRTAPYTAPGRPPQPDCKPTVSMSRPKARLRSASGSDSDTASPRIRLRRPKSRDRSLSVSPTRGGPSRQQAGSDAGPVAPVAAPVASGSHSPQPSGQSHTQQDAAMAGSWPAPEASTSAAPAQAPPRKQNVACDACRSRKVKCVRNPGSDQCQHCAGKNLPCTNLIQQATSEKKRQLGGARRGFRSAITGDPSPSTPGSGGTGLASGSARGAGVFDPALSSAASGRNTLAGFLAYIFAPPREDPHPAGVQTEDWGVMGTKLESETFRTEFALDLIDVYFQICHTRLPILDPQNFRNRFKYSLPQAPLPPPLPARDIEPLPFALIAVVLAWGAKFSEHPIIVHDRQNNRDKSSALARSLVKKAREVAETDRVFRIATPDNVFVCLLLEPLHSHMANDPDGFHGFWLNSGVRHMLELRINHKVGTIATTDSKGASIVMSWWMACLADGFSSAYFRSKPVLDDDDYNIQALTNNTFLASTETLGIGTPADFITWYSALHALACDVRRMSRSLWTPVVAEEGVPAKVVQDVMARLNRWRDGHLSAVGVPSNFESDWNFVTAVSACSSDASFHVMFIILHQAVEEFGIRELRRGTDPPGVNAEIEALRNALTAEAMHSALRIAALTGVLTTNGYLRLDPNVLHYSTYCAGLLLARQGRPEAVNCITGLRQYAFAYEEAHIQADELEATLAAVNRERTQREQSGERTHAPSPTYNRAGQLPFAAGLPAVSMHHPSQGSLMNYGGAEAANSQYGVYEPVASMSSEQPPHDRPQYNTFSSRR